MDRCLVVMCGLPGVGKTTASERIIYHLEAERLRSDVVRKELFDEPTYSSEESDRVYEELRSRAETQLTAGQSVVLDATFSSQARRDAAAAVAADVGVEVVFVHVVCDESVVTRRIRERENDASDADVEVYRRAKQSFEKPDRKHVRIDTTEGLASMREQVDSVFDRP